MGRPPGFKLDDIDLRDPAVFVQDEFATVFFTCYDVRKGTWHTHTLSPGAMVLIVENRDTTFDNSPFCSLTDQQQDEIVNLTRTLWAGGTDQVN